MSIQTSSRSSDVCGLELVIRAMGAVDSNESVVAAQSRLALLEKLARQEKRPGDITAKYYGQKQQEEEIIDGVLRSSVCDAILTRNQYGCVVMNAARAHFIDVDFAQPSRTNCHSAVRDDACHAAWQQMFDDLCIVLASHREHGFRIYRTAAGFRILTTTREFDPGEPQSQRLMTTVGADSHFVDLCRIQKCFRARLSPKPWRCGAKRPPNPFPRTTQEAERQFADWVADYERACRDRATCKYLGHIGRSRVADELGPIIDVHDRETRAFEALPLA